MEPFAVLLMKKDINTGFLESEIGSYMINENGEYIDSIFVIENESTDVVHLRITTEIPVKDWEYSAIYDYYDEEAVQAVEEVIGIEPIEDEFNPVWEVTFKLHDIEEQMEDIIARILLAHKAEIHEVYEEIKGREEEYK